MLSVILMILKIIGIVLLSLLGLVLLLLLLVLAVPVRYRGKAGKAEAIAADVHVTWLLHLVHLIVSYGEEGLVKKIKIFGFALKDKSGDSSKKGDDGTIEAGESDTGTTDTCKSDKVDVKDNPAAVDKTDNISDNKADSKADNKAETAGKNKKAETVSGKFDDNKLPGNKVGKKKNEKDKKKSGSDKTDKPDTTDKTEPEEIDPETGEKQSFFDKIEAKKTDIAEKLKNIYNKLVHYKEIIDDPRFRNGIRYALNRLFAALRHILPRRLRGRAHYGFEDPSTTGYITAAVGATYGMFSDHMKFEPDFENEVLEGDIEFRGHVRLGTVLFIALQVILKKDCRFVYKTIKAEGKD